MKSRQCWICLMNEDETLQDTEFMKYVDKKEIWVRPCKCTGATQWIHKYCFMRYIENRWPTNNRCSFCKVEYVIISSNYLYIFFYEKISEFIAKILTITSLVFMVIATYICLFSYGFSVFVIFMGFKESMDLLFYEEDGNFFPYTGNLLRVFMGAPLIPITMIYTSYVKFSFTFHILPSLIILNYSKMNFFNAATSLLPLTFFIYKKIINNLKNKLKTVYRTGTGNTYQSEIVFNNQVIPLKAVMSCLVSPYLASFLGYLFFNQKFIGIEQSLMGGVLYVGMKDLLSITYLIFLKRRSKNIKIIDQGGDEIKENTRDDFEDINDESFNGEILIEGIIE